MSEFIYVVVSYNYLQDYPREHIMGAFTKSEDAENQAKLDNDWAVKNSEVIRSKVLEVQLNDSWS